MSRNFFSRIPDFIRGLAHFLVRSKWSYLVIGLVFPLFWIVSWICARHAPSFFIDLAREDSWIENTQMLVLVVAIVMSGCVARKLYGENLKLLAVLYALFAVVLFFLVGEEISWGQRILGISTPRWFMSHNKQHQLTVHNLWSVQRNLARVRWGVPFLLIALSGVYAALGKKRIERWRAYLWMPHPMLIPLWLCYASYNVLRPIWMAMPPGKPYAPDVISKLSESAELIIYSGIVLFLSMVLTHEAPAKFKAARH